MCYIAIQYCVSSKISIILYGLVPLNQFNMDKLLLLLSPVMGRDYAELGFHLGFRWDVSILNREAHLCELLDDWLRRGSPSWFTLRKALLLMGYSELSKEIDESLSGK